MRYAKDYFFIDLASLRIPFGDSKFSYNEALHSRSSVLESHDDIAQGIEFLVVITL